MTRHARLLVLEDGRTFHGDAYGAEGETFGEAVFSTGMTGYQETLTDPSYHRQVVVMTAPHIGNTGVNDEDPESRRIWVAGYVVRDPARRAVELARRARTLDDELARPGRRRHQRHRHPRADPPPARARRDAGRDLLDRDRPRARCWRGCSASAEMAGADLAGEVTTAEAYVVPGASGEKRFTVAALDLGIKAMTPHRMAERGIEVHVLPATATLDDVLAVAPDGRVLLQRPRRPGHRRRTRSTLLRGVLERGIPYFGICFGNQLFGRALGFGTYKLSTATAASTSRCMDRTTGKVEVTAHNHGFAVDAPARRADRRRRTAWRRSATSASTTTWSRASSCASPTASCRRSRCSTTPRPRPARTTRRTSSTGSCDARWPSDRCSAEA